MASAILGFLFVPFLILLALNIQVAARICQILKSRHTKKWIELGAPSIFYGGVSGPLNRFVFDMAYKQLQDEALTKSCKEMRMLTLLLASCLTLIVFCSFLL